MKVRQVIFLILFVLIVDQTLKFYIKLHFHPGDEVNVLGTWFRFHFVENEGMAWGWKFGGDWGKIFLTLFRLVAGVWGIFLIKSFIEKKNHRWFIACVAMMYAGALGNLIDSLFYGLIFDKSYNSYDFQNSSFDIAKAFTGHGYGSFLHGKVVDMIYLPIISTTYPSWVPFLGGSRLDFFEPVFNVADASISIGVIIILIFQNTFFPPTKKTETSLS